MSDRASDAATAALPLAGALVVEFCQAMAGPFCTQMLADMGARVIKVEKPGGDDSRGMPPYTIGDSSAYFAGPNRNKESIVLDLKSDEGREVALRLIERADIVVENNRPGVMARLGLGFEQAKAVNPDIVYASISGFGQDGPYRDMAAYDPIVQAMSGVMSLTGEEGRKPVRVGVAIGDLTAAMLAAFGAVSALCGARADGIARHVDASMLDGQIAMLQYHLVYYLFSGIIPQRQGQRHSGVPEQGEFTASDGVTLFIAPMAEKMWQPLCRALGLDDLAADPELSTRMKRMGHIDAVRGRFEAAFASRPAQRWVDVVRAAGIPITIINTLDRVAVDPQVLHREMIADTEYAGEAVKLIGSPLRINGIANQVQPPPRLGQHSRAILQDLGYDATAAEALLATGHVAALA